MDKLKVLIFAMPSNPSWTYTSFATSQNIEVSFADLGKAAEDFDIGFGHDPWHKLAEFDDSRPGTLKVDKNRGLKDSAHPQPFYRKGRW